VLVIAAPIVFGAMTVLQTLVTSLLSQGADASERGALLGLANGVGSVARIFGPVMSGYLFVAVAPHASLIAIALIIGASLVFAFPLNTTRSAALADGAGSRPPEA
jgi:hypothetical protein